MAECDCKVNSSEGFHGVAYDFKFSVPIDQILHVYSNGRRTIRNSKHSIKLLTFEEFVVGNRDLVFDIEVTASDVLAVRLIRRSQRLNEISVINSYAFPTGLDAVYGPMEELPFYPGKLLAGSDQPKSSTVHMKRHWKLERVFVNGSLEAQSVVLMRDRPRMFIHGSIFYSLDESVMLKTSMARLINNPETSDVEIIVGENKFFAHKLLLATRSSFFKGMFNSNMKESQENVIKLPEDNPKVFEQVLHYIYTDTCPEISKMAVELLIPADKYDLKGLRMLCEEEMMKTMNKDNVCDYLVKSGMTNAKRIHHECFHFITKHNIDVTKTKGSKSLKNREKTSEELL